MLNTTKAFLLSLFDIFIVWIVLGNFLGWSGGAISLTGYSVDWSNSYIGFQSLDSAVKDFNVVLNAANANGVFSTSRIPTYFNELFNTLLLGIPKFIQYLQNYKIDISWEATIALVGQIYKLVGNIVIQPLLVFAWIIMILGCLIIYIFSFIVIFFKFFGGAYNVQFTDTSAVWSQWDSIVSEWSFAVPVI